MTDPMPAPVPSEDVLSLLLRDRPGPQAAVGARVLEIHHAWRNLLVDTCHLPLDAPVTVGDAVGHRWSLLGVPLGWVDAAWAPALRLSPPLLADVRSEWRTDLHAPSELLPDGETFTLVDVVGEGSVLRVPPGGEAFLDEGGERLGLDDLLRAGRAWREGEVVVLPIPDGARGVVGLGEHVFVVRRTDRGPRVAARRLDGADVVFLATLLLCVGVGALVGLLGASARPVAALDVVDLPRPPVQLVLQPEAPAPVAVLRTSAPGGPKAPGREGRVGSAEGSSRLGGRPGPSSDREAAEDAGVLGVEGGPYDLASTGLDVGLTASMGGLGGPKGRPIGEGGLGHRGRHLGGGGGPEGIGAWGPSGGDGDDPFDHPSATTKPLGPTSVLPRDPIVVGALDPSLIDAVIKGRMASIRYCYPRALQGAPELQGMVVMAFTIAHDGSVSSARADDGLGSASAQACLTRVFQGLRFPEPKGGGVVRVRYPLVFAPG